MKGQIVYAKDKYSSFMPALVVPYILFSIGK